MIGITPLYRYVTTVGLVYPLIYPGIKATYLGGVRALILEKGMGKGRASILRKQLEAHGASVVSSLEPRVTTCTHLLAGNNVRRSRLPVLLGVKEVPGDVRADSCLIRGEYVSEARPPPDHALDHTHYRPPKGRGRESPWGGRCEA